MSKSFIIYEGDFGLRLEYNEKYVAVHLPYVNKWTPSVFKKLGIKVYETLDFVKDLGYDSLRAGFPSGDIKITKLVLMLGFEYEGTSDGYDIYRLD